VSEISADILRVDFDRAVGDRTRAIVRARALLTEYGAFVACGLIGERELTPVHEDIGRLIALKRRHLGLAQNIGETDGARFDEGFPELCRVDRAHGGTIYNACRRLMPVHHLATHASLQSLSRALMHTETLVASTLNAVRIDHPNEDKYLFLWHQDYPYIQDSEDALVYWIPLQNVNEENGWLHLALGSHTRGVFPVRVVDPGNKSRNGARSIELADMTLPDRFPQVNVPVKLGEVLVFSTLLLHKSQPNVSRDARWTIQLRHGNFEHPRAIARDWPGGLIENVPFEDSHPEYVDNIADLRRAA
jgi:hypothetical protein